MQRLAPSVMGSCSLLVYVLDGHGWVAPCTCRVAGRHSSRERVWEQLMQALRQGHCLPPFAAWRARPPGKVSPASLGVGSQVLEAWATFYPSWGVDQDGVHCPMKIFSFSRCLSGRLVKIIVDFSLGLFFLLMFFFFKRSFFFLIEAKSV